MGTFDLVSRAVELVGSCIPPVAPYVKGYQNSKTVVLAKNTKDVVVGTIGMISLYIPELAPFVMVHQLSQVVKGANEKMVETQKTIMRITRNVPLQFRENGMKLNCIVRTQMENVVRFANQVEETFHSWTMDKSRSVVAFTVAGRKFVDESKRRNETMRGVLQGPVCECCEKVDNATVKMIKTVPLIRTVLGTVIILLLVYLLPFISMLVIGTCSFFLNALIFMANVFRWSSITLLSVSVSGVEELFSNPLIVWTCTLICCVIVFRPLKRQ